MLEIYVARLVRRWAPVGVLFWSGVQVRGRGQGLEGWKSGGFDTSCFIVAVLLNQLWGDCE